jgi:uncharacterized RDD family membrane protein YckC
MMHRRYDTFVQRLGSSIIDGLLFTLFYFIVESITDNDIAWDITSDILWLGYSIYFHGRYGQTIGKMAMNIKVVDHLNESNLIGFQRAALREIGLIMFILIDINLRLWMYAEGNYVFLSLFLSCGWTIAELVTLWFNKKRRAIHDLIAGSVVIDVAKYTDWERKYYYAEENKKAAS